MVMAFISIKYSNNNKTKQVCLTAMYVLKTYVCIYIIRAKFSVGVLTSKYGWPFISVMESLHFRVEFSGKQLGATTQFSLCRHIV